MSWLEAEKFALKAKLVELTADDALIFLPGLNNSLKWPRQQLPPSLKAGDEFWPQIALASQITENWSKIAAKLLPSPLDKEVVAISYRQGRLLLRVPSSLAAQEVQF